MKKIYLFLSAVLVCVSAYAEESRADFEPQWFIGGQVGASHLGKEKTVSVPHSFDGSIYFGYQFTPVFSLRGDFSAFEANSSTPVSNIIYPTRYHQTVIDAMFDICNMFRYRSDRTVNPYMLVGTGRTFRHDNQRALAHASEFDPDYLWEKPTYSSIMRVGAGIEFRVTDIFSITLEFQDNMQEESFNSKCNNAFLGVDHLLAGQAGIKFYLGRPAPRARKVYNSSNVSAMPMVPLAAASTVAPTASANNSVSGVPVVGAAAAAAPASLYTNSTHMTRSARKAAAAAAAAALIASQQSQEEEAAAAAAAAVEAERVAAAERAAAEAKAAAAARAAERAYSATVTFVINKSDIRSEEIPVLDKVVAWMNQYPEAKVDLQGYADKFTGTAERNMVLSEERAKTVAAYLESKGIALSRMAVEFFGDTKSISTVPASNRAVVIKVY